MPRRPWARTGAHRRPRAPIERGTSPRRDYPAGWRKDLSVFHARRLAAIMTAVGYSPDEIERVGARVRKERISSDSEVQLLEDVSCSVFLAYGLSHFMAKTEEDKLARILAKTWGKMSEAGRRHALMLDLPPSVPDLLERGLAAFRSPIRSGERTVADRKVRPRPARGSATRARRGRSPRLACRRSASARPRSPRVKRRRARSTTHPPRRPNGGRP